MILFLDLEDTIINTWEDWYFCKNIESIKRWIHKQEWTDIRIFSYAIWNEQDVEEFKNFKCIIENKLNIKINDEVWTIEDLRKICNRHFKLNMDRDDFFSFMRKDICFQAVCEEIFIGKTKHCVLIDDTVENSLILKSKINISFVNAKGI